MANDINAKEEWQTSKWFQCRHGRPLDLEALIKMQRLDSVVLGQRRLEIRSAMLKGMMIQLALWR